MTPLTGIQVIHNGVHGAFRPRAIQLFAIVQILGRRDLRNKLGLIEASIFLSTVGVTVIDLLWRESLIVVERLGSWLG